MSFLRIGKEGQHIKFMIAEDQTFRFALVNKSNQ